MPTVSDLVQAALSRGLLVTNDTGVIIGPTAAHSAHLPAGQHRGAAWPPDRTPLISASSPNCPTDVHRYVPDHLIEDESGRYRYHVWSKRPVR